MYEVQYQAVTRSTSYSVWFLNFGGIYTWRNACFIQLIKVILEVEELTYDVGNYYFDDFDDPLNANIKKLKSLNRKQAF
jgi:hypothetical protein